MTMTRSKNSTCGLPICGQSTILRRTIFFQDGCNEFLTCQICGGDTYYFRLKSGGNIFYFDYHRRFLPLDYPFRLDSNNVKKENVVLKGLPRHLSGPEIADMLDNLVLDENGDQFVGYEKSITGPTNVVCGNRRMSKH
jgi:hypothetical protein